MRKPNYSFERSQREGAKRKKAEAKLQKKQEQSAEKSEAGDDLKEAHPEGQVGDGTEVAER